MKTYIDTNTKWLPVTHHNLLFLYSVQNRILFCTKSITFPPVTQKPIGIHSLLLCLIYIPIAVELSKIFLRNICLHSHFPNLFSHPICQFFQKCPLGDVFDLLQTLKLSLVMSYSNCVEYSKLQEICLSTAIS